MSWWLSVDRMQGMEAGPGVALGALGWFAATWLLMMAAMMLPALAPTLVAECFPERTRLASPRPVLVAAVFVAGYLVWALAGASAYLVFMPGSPAAERAMTRMRGMEMDAGRRRVAFHVDGTVRSRRGAAAARGNGDTPIVTASGLCRPEASHGPDEPSRFGAMSSPGPRASA